MPSEILKRSAEDSSSSELIDHPLADSHQSSSKRLKENEVYYFAIDRQPRLPIINASSLARWYLTESTDRSSMHLSADIVEFPSSRALLWMYENFGSTMAWRITNADGKVTYASLPDANAFTISQHLHYGSSFAAFSKIDR